MTFRYYCCTKLLLISSLFLWGTTLSQEANQGIFTEILLSTKNVSAQKIFIVIDYADTCRVQSATIWMKKGGHLWIKDFMLIFRTMHGNQQ